jgi:hypothetical protein
MARVLVASEAVTFPNLHFTLFSLIFFVKLDMGWLYDTVSLSSNIIEIRQNRHFSLFWRGSRRPVQSPGEVKSALVDRAFLAKSRRATQFDRYRGGQPVQLPVQV